MSRVFYAAARRSAASPAGALLTLLILTLLLILSGCGGEEASGAQPGARGEGNARVAVETDTVISGRIARVVTLPGTVEPIRTIGVNAQLSGALTELRVEEGDRVEAGEVVARLDDRELRAQLRSAEASFEVAETAFERSRQLLERQIITESEHEGARTAYAAARAQLDQLRTRVGFTEVRSPIGGVITAREVQAGDVVGNQARLLEVAEVDTMVVRVRVSELDVVEIETGDSVEVRLDALRGELLRGRVRRIFPSADPVTRLVPVEVELAESDRARARPGFLARVVFELDPRENALLVPAGALVSRGGSEGVYLVADSTVVLRSITPGLTTGERVEVLEGLQVGDRVVTAGSNLLRDGGLIRDVSARTAGASPPSDTSTPPTPGNEP